MTYDPRIHHRRSIRLSGYNYSGPGAYFVTICTWDKQCLFGRVASEVMQLNALGRTAEECWCEIPSHFPQVVLDEFIIMPNHIHAILMILGPDSEQQIGIDRDAPMWADHGVGENNHSPRSTAGHNPPAGANDYSPLRKPYGTSKTIGSVIWGFKIGVSKWARGHTHICDLWQRNYYEHIIRNDLALSRIRQYIAENPQQWPWDPDNPVALKTTRPDPGPG